MSFVICICGCDFSVMMGDGRLVEYPSGNIVSEKVMKVKKINNNVIISFTGDPLPTEKAIDSLKYYDYKNLYVPEIRGLLVEKLKALNINGLGVKIIISGKDANDRFLIDIINSKQNYNSHPIYPPNGQIAYAYAGNDEILCKSIVDNAFNNKRINNACELETLMADCILKVSRYDPTVNTNILKVVVY